MAEFIVSLFPMLWPLYCPDSIFYMLRDLALINTFFALLLPAKTNIGHLLRELDAVLGGIVGTVVSLIVGVLSFIGLTLLRIDFAYR